MHKSFTTGKPWRVIVIFAIPLLIGNVVQQLYQVIDAVVVGQNLGVNSLAAVGTTGAMIFLLLGFAWGMTAGFAIPTAQAYGAGNALAIRRSVAAGTMLSAAATVVITVAGVIFTPALLSLLQTPAVLVEEATTFAVISFAGTATMMFFNYLSAIIRATGDSRTPLVFLVISCMANIGLVILFVRYLNMGIGGAALATQVAQAASVGLCFLYIRHSIPELHVRKEDWAGCASVIWEHLRIGLPMGFQSSIIAIGALAVQVRLNLLGTEAVAAYTTATRIDGLAGALLASIGLSVSTFVAQNYGARLFDRITVGVRQGVVVGLVVSLTVSAVVILFGEPLSESFVGKGNDEVVALSHEFLLINGAFYWILSVLFVTRGALQGLGDVLVPTITGVIELVARVMAAASLAAVFGFVGVAWASPLAWISASVILTPAWLAAARKLRRRADEAAALTRP